MSSHISSKQSEREALRGCQERAMLFRLLTMIILSVQREIFAQSILDKHVSTSWSSVYLIEEEDFEHDMASHSEKNKHTNDLTDAIISTFTSLRICLQSDRFTSSMCQSNRPKSAINRDPFLDRCPVGCQACRHHRPRLRWSMN